MAITHLVDTIAIKRMSNHAARNHVEPLARAGRLSRAEISDLEIGYSARNAAEWDQLCGALDAFVRIETTTAHVARSKQVQRLLAARSQRGRKIPDLLIAAAAEMHRLTVLHYDHDFDQISAVTGQPCLWVVPAGSID